MFVLFFLLFFFFFFFNDTATTEIYTVRNTLSLHDALPIWCRPTRRPQPSPSSWPGPCREPQDFPCSPPGEGVPRALVEGYPRVSSAFMKASADACQSGMGAKPRRRSIRLSRIARRGRGAFMFRLLVGIASTW